MSDFYYHGMKFTPISNSYLYNRAIDKLNDLISQIRNESALKGATYEFDISLPIMLTPDLILIVKISNNDWNAGIFNIFTNEFVTCPVEVFDNQLTERAIQILSRTFNRCASAVKRNEISIPFSTLPSSTVDLWNKYLSLIPPEQNFSNVSDLNLTDNIQTNHELHEAVLKAKSSKDESDIDLLY
ncbi:hypothetical protein SAMN02910301_2225 [Lachnospiraceae bacterium XBD2001]|nr:hypothetical protein SAMN02910301_2225 [Lachnospiraceae bacterium XBD2001]